MDPAASNPNLQVEPGAIMEMDLEKFDDLFSDTDSEGTFDSSYIDSDEGYEDDSDYGSDDSEEEESDEDEDSDDDEEVEMIEPSVVGAPSTANVLPSAAAQIAMLSKLATAAEAGIIAKNEVETDESRAVGAFTKVLSKMSMAEDATEEQQETEQKDVPKTEDATPPSTTAAQIAMLSKLANAAEAGIIVKNEVETDESKTIGALTKVLSNMSLAEEQQENERKEVPQTKDATPPSAADEEAMMNAQGKPAPTSSNTSPTPGAPIAASAPSSKDEDDDVGEETATLTTTSSKRRQQAAPKPAYPQAKEMDVADLSHLLNKTRLEHFAQNTAQEKGVTAPEELRAQAKQNFVARAFFNIFRPSRNHLSNKKFQSQHTAIPANTILNRKAKKGATVLVDQLKFWVEKQGYQLIKMDADLIAEKHDDNDDFFVPITKERVEKHSTVIQKAIQEQDLDTLRRLHKEEGNPLNTCNKFGESVLHSAARRCLADVLRFLIDEMKVDVRVKDDYGRTPMHDACWTTNANLEVAQILLDAWPDFLYISDQRGYTPLQYVRKDYWPEWTQFLDKNKEKLLPKQLSLPKKMRKLFSFRK